MDLSPGTDMRPDRPAEPDERNGRALNASGDTPGDTFGAEVSDWVMRGFYFPGSGRRPRCFSIVLGPRCFKPGRPARFASWGELNLLRHERQLNLRALDAPLVHPLPFSGAIPFAGGEKPWTEVKNHGKGCPLISIVVGPAHGLCLPVPERKDFSLGETRTRNKAHLSGMCSTVLRPLQNAL